MYQYSVTQWVFFFYLYCFLGWCFESAYVSIRTRKLTNRGFMHGPFLPLYGSGAIMMLVVSMPFQNSIVLTYLAGCVGATVLEYVTGVTMEALFKVRYWDYSNQKYNFQGHICLSSTLAWGGLTILMTEVIHRPIEQMVLAIPAQILTAVTFFFTALIFSDFAWSFKEAMDLRNIMTKLEKARLEIGHMQKRLDVVIALTSEELEQKIAEYREEIRQKTDSIGEAIGGARENFTDAIAEKKESITGVIAEKKESFAEKKDGLMQLLTEFMEEFGKSAEQADSQQVKEELCKKVDDRQRELLHRQKELWGSVSKQLGKVHRSYPTMMSRSFRDIFEELRRAAEDEDDKHS